MPMPSSFMQMASPRPPMPPVTRAMRCAMVRLLRFSGYGVPRPQGFLGALPGVLARRGLDRFLPAVAQLLACRHHLAPERLQPFRPHRPPAAGLFLGVGEPLLRVGR